VTSMNLGKGLIAEDLYRTIVAVVPLACVDLLVVDALGSVLLMRRRDEPARGQWWLPGGRVHFGETREQAALRKLREECGLRSDGASELLTADLLLEDGRGSRSHGVTTVFRIDVPDTAAEIIIDEHSICAEWRSVAGWGAEDLHPFVHRVIGMAG
jgi:ADP-ribose pyrophosphatase YjhB (NUDIX family)